MPWVVNYFYSGDASDPVVMLNNGVDGWDLPNGSNDSQLWTDRLRALEFDVPSSFGLLVTSEDFLEEHPEVVADFLRASLRAFAFSVENPEAAVEHALAAIAGGDNPAFLGDYSEIPRWTVERQLVIDTTADGEGFGLIDEDRLEAEIEALTSVGVFDEVPDWQSMIAPDLARDLYDGTDVLWPED